MCQQSNKSILHFFTLIFCLMFCAVAYGLNSDNHQPMVVSADSGNLNKATGMSVFTGHVKVTQGTTVLTADEITLYTDQKNKLIKAEAQGHLASYSTLTDVHKPRFEAVANTIQYFPKTADIILIGQAKASQGPNSYAAPKIEYNMNQKTVISRASKQGRTTIVIKPDSIQ